MGVKGVCSVPNAVDLFGRAAIAVERGGRVFAHPVPDAKASTLLPNVTERVLSSAVVFTNEHAGYDALEGEGYVHHRIKHAAKVYACGDVHTQTIEGYWSLVKRGLSGTHHAVSAKHLQGYLNEYLWRYNNRDLEGPAQFLLLILRAASTPV